MRFSAVVLFWLALPCTYLMGQEIGVPVVRAETKVGIVNVVALDKKDGAPIAQLQRSDFQLEMDRRSLPIAYFDHGADAPLRPLTFWIITECVHGGSERDGSTFLRGHAAQVTRGLAGIEERDTVGVAHWCADGNASIDLKPEHDLMQLAQRIDADLEEDRRPSSAFKGRASQKALATLVELLDYDTVHGRPGSRPVLLFFHEGEINLPITTDTATDEGDHAINQLLTANAMSFVVNDGRHGDFRRTDFGHLTTPITMPALYSMAYWTGGVQSLVREGQFAEAVRQIVNEVHARYDLGFNANFDRWFHYMDVVLTADAKRRYPRAVLQYRRGFWRANRMVGEQ